MLSVLIPVYNYDVTSLVSDLSRQCEAEGINYEIILTDDASAQKYREINRNCKQIKNVIYNELPANIGRARIRNKLAETAKYEHLLFIDCDSFTPDNLFIKRYLENMNSSRVLCGGRIYEPVEPKERKYYLRWLYGVKRESFSAAIRNRNSNKSFMTNNFVISKDVFKTIKFDENIISYGHEDTLFGIELLNNNVIIKHIDNPLIHIGLETADEFIKKTREGVGNLNYILGYYKNTKQLINSFKLLQWHRLVRILYLDRVIAGLFRLFENQLEKNLKSNNPLILIFDIYKLGYLCFLNKK